MATVYNTTFQLRRGKASVWEKNNPILSRGEPGFEIDTNRLKIGDGSASWSELDYIGEKVSSSWNDLTDKPFGETMSSGDTFKWDPETDYENITVEVPITDTYRFCKVSDVVPSFDDVAGGYTYEDGDGVGMGGIVSDDKGYINCGKFVIAYEENCSLPYYDYGIITLPETGIYIPVGENLSYATHTITIPGFTGFPPVPVFKRMDEKYMPLLTSEDGQVWKLVVTPDGEVIAEYVSG